MRVGVRGGGCSGFSYVLEPDAAPARPDDVILEVHGVVVRVDKKSMRVLAGTTLDYKVGLMDAGFKFDNPRATKTCGCGESFSMS
jgi:iron-sulfur cluster assembly protein